MIRLLIVVVGVFLIWVLFVSDFNKQRKIIIAAIAVALSIFGVWLESSMQKPKTNIVPVEDIVSCGITAKHSYRTNFDLALCLQNNSADGFVKRIQLDIIATRCSTVDACQELQRVTRDIAINLAPNSSITVNQNLSFSEVDLAANGVLWSTETKIVKAVK